MKRATLNYKVNHQINAAEVRVIDAEGKQVGVMKLSEALKKAREEELDLVEVAPMAKPPVAKIVNLGKFKYQEEKKLRKEKKRAKPTDLKEVRFSPFIHAHDFDNRIERMTEFLEEKHKVRVVVVFLGRQMGSKKFGYQLLDRIVKHFEGKIIVDMQPRFLGRHLVTVISPINKPANQKTEVKEKKENAENKN